MINRHRKEAKEAEAHAKAMLAKVEEQKHEISALHEQLKMLQHKMKPSPATRSSSQYTLDGKQSHLRTTSSNMACIFVFNCVIFTARLRLYSISI